jgi:hypothetical protein
MVRACLSRARVSFSALTVRRAAVATLRAGAVRDLGVRGKRARGARHRAGAPQEAVRRGRSRRPGRTRLPSRTAAGASRRACTRRSSRKRLSRTRVRAGRCTCAAQSAGVTWPPLQTHCGCWRQLATRLPRSPPAPTALASPCHVRASRPLSSSSRCGQGWRARCVRARPPLAGVAGGARRVAGSRKPGGPTAPLGRTVLPRRALRADAAAAAARGRRSVRVPVRARRGAGGGSGAWRPCEMRADALRARAHARLRASWWPTSSCGSASASRAQRTLRGGGEPLCFYCGAGRSSHRAAALAGCTSRRRRGRSQFRRCVARLSSTCSTMTVGCLPAGRPPCLLDGAENFLTAFQRHVNGMLFVERTDLPPRKRNKATLLPAQQVGLPLSLTHRGPVLERPRACWHSAHIAPGPHRS